MKLPMAKWISIGRYSPTKAASNFSLISFENNLTGGQASWKAYVAWNTDTDSQKRSVIYSKYDLDNENDKWIIPESVREWTGASQISTVVNDSWNLTNIEASKVRDISRSTTHTNPVWESEKKTKKIFKAGNSEYWNNLVSVPKRDVKIAGEIHNKRISIYGHRPDELGSN